MKKKLSGFDVGVYAAITLFSLLVLYPFYYTVINSFNASFSKAPDLLWPASFSVKAYELVFRTDEIFHAFTVSVARTVAGIATSVLVCAMCAFALRKRNLLFRNFYLILFTIPMFFGGGLIPNYLNYYNLRLVDTFWIYILPYLFSFYYVIILMSCFNEVPQSLEEAAMIDGANYFSILFRIYMPVSVPVLATIALFVGVSQWNRWFDTMYFTKSDNLMTLAGVLIRIVNKNNVTQELSKMANRDTEELYAIGETVKLATMVVAVTPIIFIYPFFQRYFIKGITIGSVKE